MELWIILIIVSLLYNLTDLILRDVSLNKIALDLKKSKTRFPIQVFCKNESLIEEKLFKREINETIQWKENLRQRINSEKPAMYSVFEQYIPPLEVFDFVPFSTLIKNLEFSVLVLNKNHINIFIRDADSIRWEMPYMDPFPFVENPSYMDLNESEFEVKIDSYEPFHFSVIRRSTKEVIVQLVGNFIFADRYIEFSFQLASNEFHGWGERLYTFDFKPGTFSEFLIDRSGELEQGKPGFNAHGHHPLYIVKEKSKKWHLNFFRNINGQEFSVDDKGLFKYKMIGGVIDMNIFVGDNPEEVVKVYHDYIGGWSLPSFWSMGVHQCKWNGYVNVYELEKVINRYNSHNLPLDGLWSDLEYQYEKINFSIDEERYPPEEMTKLFMTSRKRWIAVIDTVVPYERTGPAWEYPKLEDLLIKDHDDVPYYSYLFKINYFIDFWHPKTKDFWFKMLGKLRSKAFYEGIWLDANEFTHLANYRNGKYRDTVPFWPGGKNWYDINLPNPHVRYYGEMEEIDARNTQNLLQSKYTFEFLRRTNPFPFILSRSSVPGTGKFAAHFYPDYKTDWTTLKISISSTFSANIYGNPISGGDLCGNGGEEKTSGELCARWHQLGIFYPFVRNHHMYGVSNHQEPYLYDGIYFEAISSALKLRYSILKFYYSLIFAQEGNELKKGMFFKPLRFTFHDDPNLPPYGDDMLMTQLMIGDGLMVAPAVNENETEYRNVFFPTNITWYDLRDLTRVRLKDDSRIAEIDVSLPKLAPYFLKEGFMIFYQNSTNVLVSDDLNNEFEFVVALADSGSQLSKSIGYIMNINDFSESNVWNECIEKNCMVLVTVEFSYDDYILNIRFDGTNQKKKFLKFSMKKMTILGIEAPIIHKIVKIQDKTNDHEMRFSITNEDNLELEFSDYEFIIRKEKTLGLKLLIQ